MYVITFANPKGGSGKTTSAFLLAEQIALADKQVAVLDLDPNANIVSWATNRESKRKSKPFKVYKRMAPEDVVEFIDELEEETDYLIIDLEGSKDQMITFALSRSDLCLIPLDGSPMEAKQAAHAVRLVQTTSKMIRTDIRFALLFTRTNAAFQTSDERDVRKEMKANKIPTIDIRIAKRAPYTRIFRDDLLLSEMPDLFAEETLNATKSIKQKSNKQIQSAISNAKAYAQSVINFLTKQSTHE